MEYLTLNKPKENISLWGLIREDRYSDHTENAFGCLFSKAHRSDGEWIEGLLLFPSPLHAEIYRLWLQTRGDSGWRRFRTTDGDITDIIRRLREKRLQLWIAAGFAASETQQLLLDENNLLMTSSLGIDLALHREDEERDGDGVILKLPSNAVRILKELFASVGSIPHGAEDGRQARWWSVDDEPWEERAADALARIVIREFAEYQKDCGDCRAPVALAQFDHVVGKWLFNGNTADRWH